MSTTASGLIRSALEEAAPGLDRLRRNEAALAAIEAAGDVLAQAFVAGNRAYSCANVGSMCDALPFAEELTARIRRAQRPPRALAISGPGHRKCTSNHSGLPED